MPEAGLPPDAIHARLEACFAAYVRELERLLADGARIALMPGVADLVPALPGRLPLSRAGASASDDGDRRRLPPIARARARAASGHEFPPERVTIIGDTPLDVDCARACGAVAGAG